MTTLLRAPAARPLAPIVEALAAVRARRGPAPVHGLAPGLVVSEPGAWLSGTLYSEGFALPHLLEMAARRWSAQPAAAAALAWKSYTYWLALPAVLGYATARRVPVMSAGNVLIQPHGAAPFLEVGLLTPRVAMLANDPLAGLGLPDVEVLPDEAALLAMLRATLLDGHLRPVLDQLRRRVNLGRRTLLGSIASAVAYGLVRASDTIPGGVAETAASLLGALDLADLVEITPTLEVQRRTCCLAFTLPQPKVCSGCCIPPSAQ